MEGQLRLKNAAGAATGECLSAGLRGLVNREVGTIREDAVSIAKEFAVRIITRSPKALRDLRNKEGAL